MLHACVGVPVLGLGLSTLVFPAMEWWFASFLENGFLVALSRFPSMLTSLFHHYLDDNSYYKAYIIITDIVPVLLITC